jgi:hypothetical protein
MHHHLICCKLTFDLHRNNKLNILKIYFLKYIFQNFLKLYFEIIIIILYAQKKIWTIFNYSLAQI